MYGSDKTSGEETSTEDKQTLAELSSVHCCLLAKCQQVQTSYIKQILKLFLFAI